MATINKIARKIFIGNLPWTVSNRELKLYFSKFGHVENANVVFEKSFGMSRGYGFVTFSSIDGYRKALNEAVHRLEGRVLNIKQSDS